MLSDRDEIAAGDLPESVASAGADGAPEAGGKLTLREAQRRHVLSVMESVGGNRAQAARILQVSERNLYRLLRIYAPAKLS